MIEYKKNNSTGLFLVLAGLWAINILILFFGFPFLVFKKAQEIFTKSAYKSQKNSAENPKSARYFPCRN